MSRSSHFSSMCLVDSGTYPQSLQLIPAWKRPTGAKWFLKCPCLVMNSERSQTCLIWQGTSPWSCCFPKGLARTEAPSALMLSFDLVLQRSFGRCSYNLTDWLWACERSLATFKVYQSRPISIFPRIVSVIKVLQTTISFNHNLILNQTKIFIEITIHNLRKRLALASCLSC